MPQPIHKIRIPIHLEFSDEFPVQVIYTYSPGIPEAPEEAGKPCLPAEPPVVDIREVTLVLSTSHYAPILEHLAPDTLDAIEAKIMEAHDAQT